MMAPNGPMKFWAGRFGRRDLAERDPGGQISRRVGDQREEKQRAGAEQKEGEDFIPGGVFESSGHCGSQ